MRTHLSLGDVKADGVPEDTVNAVAETLRTSNFLKISEDGKKVGRKTQLVKPEDVIEQIDTRTVAASPLPYDVKLEDVESYFSQFGTVNSVRLPKHVSHKNAFCGTALVEFSTEEDAEKILMQTLAFAGADLELKPKKDFDAEREKEAEKFEKVQGPGNRKVSEEASYPKGLIVAFTLKSKSSGDVSKQNGTEEHVSEMEVSKTDGESVANVSEEASKVSEDSKDGSEEKKEVACDESNADKEMKTDGESVANVSEEASKVSEDSKDGSEEKKEVACDESNADKEMKEIDDSEEKKDLASDESNGDKEVKESNDGEKTSENADKKDEQKKPTEGKPTAASFKNNQDVVIREDLKAVFEKFGTVKYIDFKMGEESGYIRFEEPEASQKARAAAVLNEEGGLLVKNYIATLEPVSGDAEKEYWSQIQGNQKSYKGNRGRGGKFNRGGGRRGRGRDDRSSGGRPNKVQRVAA
ncbi:hypothetical protein RND81_10G160600 [Saponaria officinalis]